MNILGLHTCFGAGTHEAAACLVSDGSVIAACEEERFSRVKGAQGALPIHSALRCLHIAGIQMRDVDLIAHPGSTYQENPPRIQSYLRHYFGYSPPIHMVHHQMAHVASAYFSSGMEAAMCLSYDGRGDQLSAALVSASHSDLELLETRSAENSLGQFYGAMTSFLGFRVNEDEYKVMGLAPYGRSGVDLTPVLRPTPDGYELDTSYITDYSGINPLEAFYSEKLLGLLGPQRLPDEPITQRHMDIALAAQQTFEQCAVSLIEHLHRRAVRQGEQTALCLAGGAALNCSANGVISQLPIVEKLFVPPVASDRGLALGAALLAAAEHGEKIRPFTDAYLGMEYEPDTVRTAIEFSGYAYSEPSDPAARAAEMLAEGKIVGWYQGRSESGPRALGNRSILADPREASMKDEINTRVKFREEFRPFAPSVLEERATELFDMPGPSPYMTVAYPVRDRWRERIRAVTHINGTARVQTVQATVAPLYHALIREFDNLTGVPAVLNTSFNVRGQPIVETPLDAIGTFAATGLDAAFLGPFLIAKKQPL